MTSHQEAGAGSDDFSQPVGDAALGAPLQTVEAVAAGVYWDAIATDQTLGLAALSVLEQETSSRPRPVIWDTRSARTYFLVPPGDPVPVDFALGVRRKLITSFSMADRVHEVRIRPAGTKSGGHR